jgi:hypothetical protein
MTRYTDIGRVPGAWRDSSIATRASEAIRTTGYYDSSAPSPSSIPSNASGSVNVSVTPSNAGRYESLRAEGERISRALVNGTASRSEVESYNARVRSFSG